MYDENTHEEAVVVQRQMTQNRASVPDASRRLYGSSLYSETSVATATSLMSERVVRSPVLGG